MEMIVCNDRPDALLDELARIWRDSVAATHLFLTPEEIDRIAPYVPDAIRQVPQLFAVCDQGRIVGFAGVAGRKLEMLFLAPDARGRGIGRTVVEHLIKEQGIARVCVNEQNPAARGFYERMGFRVRHRTPLDDAGRPYPLLHMER